MKVPSAERQVSKNQGNIPQLPSISLNNPTAFGVGVGQAGVELGQTVQNAASKITKQLQIQKQKDDAALNARLLNDFKNSSNDFMYSQETITKNINGVDYEMPKGILNRTEWQAKGSTKEWEEFYANNQNKLLESSNDPESLFYELESINQAKTPKVGLHEVAQSKADQDNSYKTIIGRAITDAYESTTPKELGVLFNEAEKYQKELDPDLVDGVKDKIADKAISGAIMRDPSGAQANILLTGIQEKISAEKFDTLKKSIVDKTSTMRKNLVTQEKKQQYVVGTDLLNKLANNEIGLSDEESIKDMGVKREISQELTNAVIKTIYNPIEDFDDEGKDEAFIDLAKSILNDTDIERKNKNLVDILDGFTGGDLSQRRMQLLVQTANEMGLGVEANKESDEKKKILQQTFNLADDWATKAGIEENGFIIEDAIINGIKGGMTSEEASLDAINKEIQRQKSSNKKEILLDDNLSKSIMSSSDVDLSLSSSEKDVYQYLLKTGLEQNEAASTAQGIFALGDVTDIAKKMAQALPELKYSMPKTQEAVKKYGVFQEILDFMNPISEAQASEMTPEQKGGSDETIKYLKENFDNPNVIAGIMGNIDVESAGSFDPKQKQIGGGKGEGLFQLSKKEFKDAYKDYLNLTEGEDNIRNQIYFMKSVLDSKEFYDIGDGNRIKLQKIFKDGSVEEITSAFEKLVERPNPEKAHSDRRLKKAKEWVDRLSGVSSAYGAEEYTPQIDKNVDDSINKEIARNMAFGDGQETKEHKFLNSVMDILSGGMSIEEWETIRDEKLKKLQSKPDEFLSLGKYALNQLTEDINTAKFYFENPLNALLSKKYIRKEVSKKDLENIDNLGSDLFSFIFGPFSMSYRAAGGAINPEQKNAGVQERLTQSIKDVFKEPGAGAYGGRSTAKLLEGKDKITNMDVLLGAGAGMATDVMAILIAADAKGVVNSIKNLPAQIKLNSFKQLFKQIEKELPQTKEGLKALAEYKFGKGAMYSRASKFIDSLDATKIYVEAQTNPFFGNYVAGAAQKVARKGLNTLRMETGSLRFPDIGKSFKDNLKGIIDYKFDAVLPVSNALKILKDSGLSEKDLSSSGVQNFIEGQKEVSKKDVLNFVEGIQETQSLDPLIEEAKGKTLEEFIKSQTKGKRFHGTGKSIDKMSEYYYSSLNYYGQGFYTTDSQGIAEGYTKKGGKEPSLYSVYNIENANLYDMEQSVPEKIKEEVGKSLGEYSDLMNDSKNMRELFDNLRDELTNEGMSADAVQEYYDSIRSVLEENGYEGLSHIGGLKTGNSAHKVNIYWNTKDIAIEKTQTKQQLTDIWNKANKPPIKPPVDKPVASGGDDDLTPEEINIRASQKKGKPVTSRNLEKEVAERIKSQGAYIENDEIRAIREDTLLGKETIDEIILRKRGIITDKEAIERASSMRGTIDEVLNIPKGSVPNKEQQTAISQVVQQERELNKKLVDLIDNGGVASTPSERALIRELQNGRDITEEEALQQALEQSTIKLRKAEIVLFAAKSEAGRALQGAKQAVDAIDSRLRIALNKMKRLPLLERQAMTEELATVHLDDNQKFIDFLDKIETSDWFDKFGEWATAIKLYNPTTHVVNFASNIARQLTDMAIVDGLSPQYAHADVQGAIVGLKQGLKNALKAMTDEGYASQLSKYIEEGGTAPAIKGAKGKVIRTSFRALGAGDEIFKAMAYQRSLYRQAARMTNNDPEAMKALLERPTFEMMDKANENAKRMTFQEDMDEVSKKVNEFRTPSNFKNPVAKTASLLTRIFVPFLKTPMNLAKQAVDISPLGLVKNRKALIEAIKTGDDEKAKTIIGEAVIGTAIVGGVALLVAEGRITGGAPRDKKARDQFYREGKIPYAIKIGDTWFQYKRVDPASTVTGITADAMILAKNDEIDIGGLTNLVSQNLEDKTFLRGINDLMKLATGEPWEREAAIKNAIVGSTIPSLFGHIARTIDPVVRSTDTLKDKFVSQIPLLSQTLPPKVNVLGNDIERASKGLNYFFNPIQSVNAEIDPVTKELSNLGYNIPLPSDYFTRDSVKYTLTPDEYYDFSKFVGEGISNEIISAMSSRGYENMSIDKKISKIEKIRKNIMDKWKKEYLIDKGILKSSSRRGTTLKAKRR